MIQYRSFPKTAEMLPMFSFQIVISHFDSICRAKQRYSIKKPIDTNTRARPAPATRLVSAPFPFTGATDGLEPAELVALVVSDSVSVSEAVSEAVVLV